MTPPRFEIRPMLLWDGPATPARDQRSSPFKAGWADTVELLVREVGYLDGKVIVVQVDAPMGSIRRDGMLYAKAKVNSPGVKVSFDSRHGPLTYATDQYRTWQANVRAIGLALEALRAVDRYGVTHSGEQYTGWSAIAATAAETSMTVDEARRVLADAAGLQPADLSTTDAINRAYKAAARKTHPDAGGNADVFRLIGAARDVLLGGLS
ncbi:hypothetical protein ACQP2Y_21740 [Actinoplanes sp. CA-051413]|uniref:hypothetical protein n=1 Tax=Actinoplanes sp. CA-051413 TaxID=3239899 RepID=UPI003D995950